MNIRYLKKFLTYSILVSAVLALSACGKSAKNSSLADQSISQLIVVSGGFGSCSRSADDEKAPNDPRTMAMNSLLQEVVENARRSGFTRIFTAVSCFSRRLIDPTNTIFFVLSTAPNEIRVGTRAEFNQAIAGLVAAQAPMQVRLVGHSYGGWSVMQQALNLDTSVQIASLTTIDPISAVNCKPGNFLLGDAGGQIGSAGCQSSPADISSTERQKIKRRVGSWTNYFQNDFQLLHSSAIPEAGVSTDLDFAATPLRAHNAIQSAPTIWQLLTKQVTTESDPLESDLFLSLGRGDEPTLFVAGRPLLDRVRLCLGRSCGDNQSAVEFSPSNKQPIAGRRLFRSNSAVRLDETAIYTLVGQTTSGEVLSTRGISFSRP